MPMTPTDQQDAQPRQMTCVRRLYVLEDDAGRTWLAVEEPGRHGDDESPAEGGAMSHRQGGDGSGSDDPAGDREGGAMSHLVPGDPADVEEGDEDQVTVVVPPKPGMLPVRLQAYRVSPALLPTGSDLATD